MGAIAVPARQLTQQVAVAAGRGFELQHGVIDPERFQQIATYLNRQAFGSADRLIGNHHMAGKRDAAG